MNEVKISKINEYLSNIPNDVLTERLILLDMSIRDLHKHNYYAVSEISDIDIIDDEITMASFKNKVDYIVKDFERFKRIQAGNNEKLTDDEKEVIISDIKEVCAIGICKYNNIEIHTSHEFIEYLRDNLDMFIENSRMPSILREYYIDVFLRGNIDYLNNYLENHKESKGGKATSKVLTKTSGIEKYFTDREAAYASVLLLPAIIVLIYLTILVAYFIFFRS